MIDIPQIIAAGLSALGFGILYDIRGKKLALAALGGALAWVAYLLVILFDGSDLLGMLCASVTASVYSEIMARLAKAPTTVFYVPAVIPLVPGGGLYYTMVAALEGNWALCAEKAQSTFGSAVAIAGGILVVISLRSVIRSFSRRKDLPLN